MAMAMATNLEPPKKSKCGIVMPISAMGMYAETHWKDVLGIFKEAFEGTVFQVDLVSEANDVGVIQKRIVQNLYSCELVICDVSGKNANVMFELGMRLAFDKPTIIVKDDETSYSFDTSPIEHLTYPRSLHYQSIQEFKELLRDKSLATFAASQEHGYTTFLKHFGEFVVANIEPKPVSKEDFILRELGELRKEVLEISRARYSDNYIDGARRRIVIPGQHRTVDEPVWVVDYVKSKNLDPHQIASFDSEEFKELVREYAKAIGATEAFVASSSWIDRQRRLLGILNSLS